MVKASSDVRSPAVIHRLTALLPPGRVMSGPAQLAAYESDGLTAFHARPLAVVVPEAHADEWESLSHEALRPAD